MVGGAADPFAVGEIEATAVRRAGHDRSVEGSVGEAGSGVWADVTCGDEPTVQLVESNRTDRGVCDPHDHSQPPGDIGEIGEQRSAAPERTGTGQTAEHEREGTTVADGVAAGSLGLFQPGAGGEGVAADDQGLGAPGSPVAYHLHGVGTGEVDDHRSSGTVIRRSDAKVPLSGEGGHLAEHDRIRGHDDQPGGGRLRTGQMKRVMSASAAMSMKLVAPIGASSPSMKSSLLRP